MDLQQSFLQQRKLAVLQQIPLDLHDGEQQPRIVEGWLSSWTLRKLTRNSLHKYRDQLNCTPSMHCAANDIIGVRTSSVLHFLITFPTSIQVETFTVGSLMDVMEQPCGFLTSSNLFFIFSTKSLFLAYPPNSLAGFKPSCGKCMILRMRMFVMGIGTPSHKHPSCTRVSSFCTQVVLILVWWGGHPQQVQQPEILHSTDPFNYLQLSDT